MSQSVTPDEKADGMRIRVIKLGGSLLDVPDLAAHLSSWRDTQLAARDVLIVGGGPAVDQLRNEQATQGLSDEEAHWRSVAWMSKNARQVHAAMTGWHFSDDASCRPVGGGTVVDVESFLRANACSSQPLPVDWRVTSDSIAAAVALALGATELVLLKSRDAVGDDVAAWAAAGTVDEFFPLLCHSDLALRFVNLRSWINSSTSSPHILSPFRPAGEG